MRFKSVNDSALKKQLLCTHTVWVLGYFIQVG